jgi:muconate cycloisomerase
MQAMDRCAAHNRFAKAAVEMALWDVLGKRAGLSLAELLGGTSHASLPITWALSADDSTAVAEEAEQKAEEGYLGFKFKMGAMPAEEDVARVRAIREKLSADIRTVVDPNGAWDEYTAGRSLQALGAAGIDIAEQPIAGWNIAGLARLRRCSTLRLMADESVQTTHDVTRVVRHHAADSVSLKIPKAGGVERAGAMADIAVAGGIALYGGSTLESSIGTAASAQLFATWPNLLGCELVGPLLLQEDIVTEPVQYKSGRLQVPVGPGLGVTLDEEKARLYARR